MDFRVHISIKTPMCHDIYCTFLLCPQEMPGHCLKLGHILLFPHPLKITIYHYPVTVCFILRITVYLPVREHELLFRKSFGIVILQQCE